MLKIVIDLEMSNVMLRFVMQADDKMNNCNKPTPIAVQNVLSACADTSFGYGLFFG